MDAEKITGQISGEVPAGLIAEFDACVDRLGIAKKRAIAAAVYAFVSASADAQHAWQRAVYDRYYADADESSGRAPRGSEADLGRRAGAAVARGGSKRRPTTGKSSA